MRLLLLLICFPLVTLAQNTAVVNGLVVDENDKPLAGVLVNIIGRSTSVNTNDSGRFSISVPVNRQVALLFFAEGFNSTRKTLFLRPGEAETITVKLAPFSGQLDPVIVVNPNKGRREPGRITIDPSRTQFNPSPVSGIEQLIKIFVGSNNELTSQYSVRGGSYDENLIYVNDFEVYRPYLVRSGQQEGLSFINPDLTGSVRFYNGGFQARYGDKLSSVLDISYRKPKQFGGSAYFGLLEQGIHLEGISSGKKFTYLLGLRNRSNRNLLGSQETKGNYVPSSSDIQALLTYQVSKQWEVELLANLSQTKFTLFPEESKLSSSVFSPFFTANLAVDIFFEGQERDEYQTGFLGLAATNSPNKDLTLKWMVSSFSNNEQENIDITGAYLFGERDFDRSQSTFGLIVNPLGAGVFQNYARNRLNIEVFNASHKGSMDFGKHFIQWGQSIEQQRIIDKLHEWEYNDSAGYSLPYNPSVLAMFKTLNGKTNIDIMRLSGYLQDNIQFKDSSDFILNAGLRYNYNDLNREFLLSPRLGVSFVPKRWTKDVVVKASAGIYHQPPFYRELRRYDGTVNTDLKAQKSWQLSLGADYNFKMFNRPARIQAEAYYKGMWDVVPFDIDNVRLRYFGENMAKAYATGIEARLFGELVPDAESWVSMGFMKTKEDLQNDFYRVYRNAAGEVITAATTDQKPVDSTAFGVGYVRRPTDRMITFGMFFQDYLSTNKNFRVYLNTLYGSNLPYNIPGSIRYRNALIIEPYIRVDIGFSALLLDPEKSNRRSHSPFRNFKSIWASLEVFNLIDRPNTISYMLIKDFANNVFTMPNRLTPRLLNLKLVAKW
ncbi:MAG: TonB-dependent receptor [Chitinophagaceae bacterium]|nr:TonB-dependent receptor [Chitinophagaceae bacterium]